MRTQPLLAATVVIATSALVVVSGQGRGQQSTPLPEGSGRELVQTTCSTCHGLNMISGSWGNTEQGWRDLFGTMVTLPKEQADTIAGYLAAHFPPRPAPEAVVVNGPARVSFKEWLVPTLGFIGTVYGLGASLAEAGSSSGAPDLKADAGTLAVGFDCTMVALAQSAILVLLLQLVQEKEEIAVNLAGDYTLRNLINRLYEGRP